jgi:hypothetical protein
MPNPRQSIYMHQARDFSQGAYFSRFRDKIKKTFLHPTPKEYFL